MGGTQLNQGLQSRVGWNRIVPHHMSEGMSCCLDRKIFGNYVNDQILCKKNLHGGFDGFCDGGRTFPGPVFLSPAEGEIPVQARRTAPGRLQLEIHIPRLRLESVSAPDGESYTQIRIEGEYTTREEGHPELPVIRRLIRVPADRSLSVSLDDSSHTRLFLSRYTLPDKIWPVQPSRPKRPDVKLLFQNPDIRAYSQKTRFPAVRLTDLGILRQERIYRLDVFPVNYDPKNGSLDLRKSLSLTLSESPGKGVYTPPPSPFFSKLTAPLPATSDNPPSLIQSPRNI